MHINILLRDVNKRLIENETLDWAGVDQGAYTLIKNGIQPKYVFGDFDSVTKEEWAVIQQNVNSRPVPSEKDFTDYELSLNELIQEGYQSFHVYGALGGRIDHELANILSLAHPSYLDYHIQLIDDYNTIHSLNVGSHDICKHPGKKYVSFLPIFNNTTISLFGLKYEVENLTLQIGLTRTVSNEFIKNNARVITNQPIIMIQSIDVY